MTKLERVKALEYYLDSELKNLAPVNGEGNVILDFDKVVPGESKTVTLRIQNQAPSVMTLEAYSKDEDLTVDHPKILTAGGVGEVNITFSPKKGRLEPLNSEWGFKMVIG